MCLKDSAEARWGYFEPEALYHGRGCEDVGKEAAQFLVEQDLWNWARDAEVELAY